MESARAPSTVDRQSIGQDTVLRAFRGVLHRDPLEEELHRYQQASPSENWLETELGTSEEATAVVKPLRNLLLKEWDLWMFRRPTDTELARCINDTRHNCSGDIGVMNAISDGSIAHKLAFRPINIEMDITNQCNLRCVMCNFSQPEFYKAKQQHLTVDIFAKVAEQAFPRANQVSLSFGTEPLLHKDIWKFFAILAHYQVPRTYMNTNAQLLRQPVIESMIEFGFHSLFVSVDAATKETYEKIRIGGKFERLIGNLQNLQRMKAEAGVSKPDFALGFVIMRQNMHELPMFIDLAADLGAVGVNAMHMIAWESVGNSDMGAVHEKERCNTYLAEAHERARARGIPLVAPQPFVLEEKNGTLVKNTAERSAAFGLDIRGKPASVCPFPWSFVAIDMRGNVVPCGWWGNPDKEMGNIYTQEFLSIWRSPDYMALRNRHLEGVLKGSCASCSAAGMGCPDADYSFSPRAR